MSEQKPLTLEELRKMDGRPVKVVYDEAAKETTPGLKPLEMICLVEYVKSAGCVVLRNNVGGKSEYYNDEELKQDGLTVYQCEPLSPDRSAWEPCELCSRLNETDPCYKDLCFTKNAPQCEYRCDKFLEWKFAQRKLQNANFCSECGRPLTDAAWETLGKRICTCEGKGNDKLT